MTETADQLDVTVVIPTYNRSRLILRALESLQQQTHRPHNIIIVDDRSTDNTVDVAREWGNASGFPLHIEVMPKNGGPAAARNRGIQLASSRYIAFLDSDDAYFPHALKRLTFPFSLSDDLAVSFADATVITPSEHIEHGLAAPHLKLEQDADAPWPEPGLYRLRSPTESLLKASILPTSATCFKRDAALAVNGMPENFRSGEDWLFWLRMATQGDFAFQQCDTALHYRHDDNLTHAHSAELVAREKMRGFEALYNNRLGIPLTPEQKKRIHTLFMQQIADWRYHLSRLGFPAYLAGLRNHNDILPGGSTRQMTTDPKSLLRASCYSLLQRKQSPH